MAAFERYAIYFVPRPQTVLARLSAHWLGWDVNSGENVIKQPPDGLPVPLPQITQKPRKYGFHGTLKAPFRLAEGVSPSELEAALAEFARTTPAADIGRMKVARLGRFVAIIPDGPAEALGQLAAARVTQFDRFRAPLTQSDLARRRSAGLTDAQDAHLVAWGYPFVLDEFRFHCTLSGPMEPPQAKLVADIAQRYFSDALHKPIAVQDACLCGERADGQFVVIKRFALTG